MLTAHTIAAYNRIRKTKHTSLLCHAPFTNLNFEQNGNVTACCFNRKEVLGKYPEQSIAEIWKGAALHDLRGKIKSNSLEGGCKLCRILLESGNYNGTKAIYYDEYAHEPARFENIKSALGFPAEYAPKVFEFEISNTCNLECEMCSGYFSSTIRKNREKLPPLHNPYDAAFVEQVAGFLPRLTDLKFLGGEPFLVDIYYSIWEKVAAINPAIKIHITTNGTVYNQRVESLLNKLRAGIVLSLDSVAKEKYEAIRIGAKYERVMENFAHFKSMAQRKHTYLSIASCVMSNNWTEIPDLVRFANAQQVPIHFNIVWNPGHLSIRFLTRDEIAAIIDFLEAQRIQSDAPVAQSNMNNYREIINTLSYWREERSALRFADDAEQNIFGFHREFLAQLPADAASRELAYLLLHHFLNGKNAEAVKIITAFFGKEPEMLPLEKKLFDMWRVMGDTPFAATLLGLYPSLYGILLGENGLQEFTERMMRVQEMLINFRQLQAVISDTIDSIARLSIAHQITLVHRNDITVLQQHLDDNY